MKKMSDKEKKIRWKVGKAGNEERIKSRNKEVVRAKEAKRKSLQRERGREG